MQIDCKGGTPSVALSLRLGLAPLLPCASTTRSSAALFGQIAAIVADSSVTRGYFVSFVFGTARDRQGMENSSIAPLSELTVPLFVTALPGFKMPESIAPMGIVHYCTVSHKTCTTNLPKH